MNIFPTFFAILASSQTSGPIPEIPADLNAIPVAVFSPALPIPQDMTATAKKLANDCEPTSRSNVLTHYRVNVLLLGAGDGKLKRVTPISMGCPKLEEYAARHFAKAAKGKMPTSKTGQDSWYRSSMNFYW